MRGIIQYLNTKKKFSFVFGSTVEKMKRILGNLYNEDNYGCFNKKIVSTVRAPKSIYATADAVDHAQGPNGSC